MGLSTIPIAPKDITPSRFFKEWLPQQVEPFKPLMSFLGDVSATLAVRVTGDSGGDWSCTASMNGLEVAEGLKDDAVITLILSVKAFLAAVTGEIKFGQPPSRGGKAPDVSKVPGMIKSTLASLRMVNGMLRYHLTGTGAEDFIVDIKFGGPLKSAPDVEVTMGRELAEGMNAGTVNPQDAFMAGKIKIDGDMSLLFQLMPLMV